MCNCGGKVEPSAFSAAQLSAVLDTRPAPAGFQYQYAVKVVCGVSRESGPQVVRGHYFTAVNIHNPSPCDEAQFRWKVAVGLAGLQTGPISPFHRASLVPDGALEIDCPDVMRAVQGQLALIKGFVVVESPVPLDIVAVYTAAPDERSGDSTLHTERVPARLVPRCEDIALNISTGVAAWNITDGQGNNTGLATIGKLSTAWNDIPGASWVSGPQVQRSTTIFQLCFDLCAGFEEPILDLRLLADNRALVQLNGNPIGVNYSSTHPWSTTPGTTTQPFKIPAAVTTNQHFRPGRNCITVTVQNDANPTGFSLAGFVSAQSGLCPGRGLPLLPCPGICYQVHERDFLFEDDHGWTEVRCNGATAGSTGEKRRVEGLKAQLTSAPPGVSVEYDAMRKDGSWTGWVRDWAEAGVAGDKERIEAIQMRLINAPPHWRIRYRVHIKDNKLNSQPGGWLPWVYDGAVAGLQNSNKRVEAMEAVIECGDPGLPNLNPPPVT